ncbi:flagellar assembly protein FliH [Ferrimonas sp. SCSIO 43195]|uniref:flagellar assembly protein FliH n=1 Tax=Ferrimonas sp. SCSIO 43195 TaxID=2822844 RepID=UPI002075939B|nr:flagellar assembly protein FliH [Ferrimonas sp. SCSIO 43195]USD38628.1 flagellar assembly protein FliH [Ferrimonas sp. SCSIO 43195]
MSNETRAAYTRHLQSQLQQGDAEQWQLPDVTQVSDRAQINAVNRHTAPAEPEPEPEELPAPPTLAEIEAIRTDAQQEGYDAGIEQGTQKGIEEGRLKGLEEGHQQGFAQGLEQGLEEGKKQIALQMQQWDALLNELIAPLQAVDSQVEQELIELTQQLARAVIGCEVKTQPEPLLLALRQAVEALPSQEQRITIRLSAPDLELVKLSYGEQELARRDWRLELEPSLTQGSVQVHTKRSRVEMPLSERIDAIFNQFINQPRSPVDEPDYPRAESMPSQPDPDTEVETAQSTPGAAEAEAEPVGPEPQGDHHGPA